MPRRFSEEEKQTIKDMYSQGYTARQIGDALGVKQQCVNYWLNKLVDKPKCQKCIYGTSKGYCDYTLVTGKMRKCPHNNCTEYVEGKKIPVDINYENDSWMHMSRKIMYSQEIVKESEV